MSNIASIWPTNIIVEQKLKLNFNFCDDIFLEKHHVDIIFNFVTKQKNILNLDIQYYQDDCSCDDSVYFVDYFSNFIMENVNTLTLDYHNDKRWIFKFMQNANLPFIKNLNLLCYDDFNDDTIMYHYTDYYNYNNIGKRIAKLPQLENLNINLQTDDRVITEFIDGIFEIYYNNETK